MNLLEIKDLHVQYEDTEILNGVNLTIKPGEIVALMGPNGSGKSTLSYTLMGHPKYAITKGSILFNGQDITQLPAHERAKLGLFLSFQYPSEISGVTVSNFLRTAYNAKAEKKLGVPLFNKLLWENMDELNMDRSFAQRSLNEGFSGGEKKRLEILQMKILDPTLAILDETDSGLDVDALKIVSEGINSVHGNDKGILLITHYQRILEYVTPDTVHVMAKGKIVHSGGKELVKEIEEKGYGKYV